MLEVDAKEYPFESKSLEIEGGYKLAYVDEGSSEEGHPCLLMVHGNPTWSFYYRNIIKAFSGTMRCVAIDHLGCGYSDKPEDFEYTLENRVKHLTELVKHLGLKNIHLMMHDWGGAIGMGYATRHPESIKSLTILNTAAFFSKRIPFRIQICKTPILGTFINRGLNGFAMAALAMATSKYSRLPFHIAQGYLHPYYNWKSRVAIDAFVKDIPTSPESPSWQTLQEIESKLDLFKDIPKIIFWGGRDFCFNDSFYKRWLEIYPDLEKHYFTDGNHYILEDKGDEIIESLKVFYEKE